ncbi:MAG: MFS transporter [Deltaproteobacteria bacterium]|nr:MFS transporter [Deltaproteobacteria bacterium]
MSGAPREFTNYAVNYFCTFGLVAFFIGFLPLHCKAIGLSAAQVSIIMACGNLSALVSAPFFMRYLKSRVGAGASFLIGAAGTVLLFASLYTASEFMQVLMAMFGFTFFWNGILIQCDASAIHHAAGGAFKFERVRLWGSLGFIAFSYLFGASVDIFGVSSILHVGAGITLLVFISSLTLSRQFKSEAEETQESSAAPKLPFFLSASFLLVVGLCWFAHSALYVYLSLYLDSLGWSAQLISVAWGVSVAAEILMLFNFHLLERRISLIWILRLSLMLTIVRWLLLGCYQSYTAIFAAQLLHAFSFASFHVASMKLIYNLLPKGKRVAGQAMLTTWGSAGGSLLGRLCIAALTGAAASAATFRMMFLFSGLVTAAALLATFLFRSGGTNSAPPALSGR